jgi:hypothetical protein
MMGDGDSTGTNRLRLLLHRNINLCCNVAQWAGLLKCQSIVYPAYCTVQYVQSSILFHALSNQLSVLDLQNK